MHVACNYYLRWVLTWKYLKQGFWGEIYIYIRGLHSVQSGVLPVYYSDHAAIYIFYSSPSFNKVCYTLRLQGCFLSIYKAKYYASAGAYVAHLCARRFFYYKFYSSETIFTSFYSKHVSRILLDQSGYWCFTTTIPK